MGWTEIHRAVSGLGEPGREESFFQLFSCSGWLFPHCPLSLVAVGPIPASAELKHSMLSSKNQCFPTTIQRPLESSSSEGLDPLEAQL